MILKLVLIGGGGGILFAHLFYNCRHKSLSMTLKSLETAAGEGSAAEQLKLLQRLLLRRLRVRLLQSQRERKSCPPHQDKRAPLMKQSKSKQKWTTLSRRFKPRRHIFSPKKAFPNNVNDDVVVGQALAAHHQASAQCVGTNSVTIEGASPHGNSSC